MTNPGDSDQWWKKYGSDGTPGSSGAQAEPTQYSSAPQFQAQPAPPPAAPVTPPPQPFPQSYGSVPQYPVQDLTPPPQPQAQPMMMPPLQPMAPSPAYPPAQPAPGYAYPNPAAYQPYGYAQPEDNNGMAIASLVSSLVGLCTCLGGIVGIILGVIALNQIKERGGRGRGMALAGIWIGAGTIVLGIAWVIIDLAVLNNSSSSSGY